MKFRTPVTPGFSFWRTVYSHGWCSLPPFEVRKEEERLRCLFELPTGIIVPAEIYQKTKSHLVVESRNGKSLSSGESKELLRQVRACLRLDEDYSGFHREARRLWNFRWAARTGAGRLLRAPTVFEDVVKMICTTNCSWALTEIMVKNLCETLGTRTHEFGYSFPRPEAIADRTEKFLRREIHAGYRAPYLLQLSKRIVKGDLNLEEWRTSSLPTSELFEEVRSVKGVGPYAAGNILKLLGRYDYLAIDSWCRKKFFEIHKNGRKTSDKSIERFYETFGQWRGLFFWLDVTKNWYDKKFPF